MSEKDSPVSTAQVSMPEDAAEPGFWKDPFGWYAVKSVRRPRTMFASAWFIIILLTAAGMPMFEQTPNSDYDWLLGKNEVVSKSYALSKAQEQTSLYTRLAERSVPQNDQLIHFMYEAKGGDSNLLKPELLAQMLDIEKTFFTDPEFATFCVADVANINTCRDDSIRSILSFFYQISVTRDANNETVSTVTPILDGTGAAYADTQAGIDALMTAIMANTTLGPLAAQFFDTGFSAVNQRALFVQSFYFLGLPLDGYANPADRSQEQRVGGNTFIIKVSDALKERFGLKETFSESSFQTAAMVSTADGDMKVYWWSLPVQENEWITLSDKDLSWTMLSFIGVGCYVAYHTGSIIISSVSMAMTVFSIFVAFFLFRVVFQITFFQFINFLIIFVVLGIGADDVFVFMDAFHQSIDELRAQGKAPTLQARIKHTMRRALHAIFVTSFTTSAAFLATALSPLMPLRSFGIFSALVIFCVFFINAIVLPPLAVLYARNLQGRSWVDSFKGFTCGLMAVAPYEDPGLALPAKGEELTKRGGDAADKYDVTKMRMTERFFYVRYYEFLKGPAKYVILLAFAGLFAGGVALWLSLEVPEEPEAWFPETHMFQQYQDLGASKVMLGGGASSALNVNVLWGISGVNDKGTDSWIPSDLGTVIYDPEFDISTAAAQAWLMQSYEALKTASCSAKACSNDVLVDPLAGIRNILGETSDGTTLTDGFYYWLRQQGGSYASAHPVSAPVVGDDFNAKMCEYSKLDATKVRYANHVGYFTEDCASNPAPVAKFILVEATSSIRMPQAPVDFADAQKDWKSFAASINAGAPADLRGAATTSTNVFWLWSVTSISLMDNVYLGLAVCFPMVFFVLTVSTGNVVLAFYSTMTIAGIVTSVIGIGAGGIMGWNLGTTEAIAAVIVIGFSVDYCVHLANAYIENDAVDRESRTRIALTTMGISVTAGAITTVVAGAFLSLCILTFFVKFSFLICWTIISSYMWAVLFFGALCMTAGPSGDFGDIGWIMRKIPGCASFGKH
jgi:hypothetical protein